MRSYSNHELLHELYNNQHNLMNRKQVKTSRNYALSKLIEDAELASSAFVGGTIGVMSVAFIVELRKITDKNLTEGCPYCMGNGEILCACCCGSKMSSNGLCVVCNGRGLVTCVNCKGDGRITPILLQSRAVRDPEFATDGISIDSP